MTSRRKLSLTLAAVVIAANAVSGCNVLQKLSEAGEPPRTSRITDPTQAPGYQQVSMPMPTPNAPSAGANSLWRPGARSFFKDQRASQIGDILTVSVNISDSGSLSNKTVTSTSNSDTAGMPALLGLENSVGKVFAGASASNLFNVNSSSGVNGTGTSARAETIVVNLAAEVTQKLPNGNLVIAGKQELRVNGDLRELVIQGIIRPEDIDSTNTISSNKIAEARIVYGGRGTLSDIQQPRYGQQILDAVSPF